MSKQTVSDKKAAPRIARVEGLRASRFTGRVKRAFLYALAILGGIPFILPFLWMLRSSVMPLWQIRIFPPQWWPAELHWEAFVEPWRELPFAGFYANSIFITVANVVGSVLSCSLAAYGFSRLRFPGRDLLFIAVLSTMLLPSQVTLIPRYVLFARLGWIDTFKPLIIPVWLAGNSFIIFLLRQFMLTISPELEDAAKIDGCNHFQIFWHIIVPLSLPALGIACIFEFISNWMNFFEPMIYLNSRDHYTVPLGLAWLQSQGHVGTRMEVIAGPLMAQSLLFLIPMVIAFYLAQRYLIRGIILTAHK
jgi:ABC-type glycerol-3-phosphate transport system permease component